MATGISRGDVRLYEFAPPDKKPIRGVPSEVLLTANAGIKTHYAVNLDVVVTVTQNRLGRRSHGSVRSEWLKFVQPCASIRLRSSPAGTASWAHKSRDRALPTPDSHVSGTSPSLYRTHDLIQGGNGVALQLAKRRWQNFFTLQTVWVEPKKRRRVV